MRNELLGLGVGSRNIRRVNHSALMMVSFCLLLGQAIDRAAIEREKKTKHAEEETIGLTPTQPRLCSLSGFSLSD